MNSNPEVSRLTNSAIIVVVVVVVVVEVVMHTFKFVWIIFTTLCSLCYISGDPICDKIKSQAENRPDDRLIFCHLDPLKNNKNPKLCYRKPLGNSFREKLTFHVFSRVYLFFWYLKKAGALYKTVSSRNNAFEEIKKTQFQDFQASQQQPIYNKREDYENKCSKSTNIWSCLNQIQDTEHALHAAHLIGFSIVPAKNSGVLNTPAFNNLFCYLSIMNAYTEVMPATINQCFDKIIDLWQLDVAKAMLQIPGQFSTMSHNQFIMNQVPDLIVKFEAAKYKHKREAVYVAITNAYIDDLNEILSLRPSRDILNLETNVNSVVGTFRTTVTS